MLKVLVPCDGTRNALHGVEHVIREYRRDRKFDVHLINVQRPFMRNVSRFSTRQARDALHAEQSALALAPACAALDQAGVPYQVHTAVGDHADSIVGLSQELGCDRIVISTSRKGALTRLIEDSLTNQLVQRTSIPVEVVAGDQESGLTRFGLPAGIGAGLLVLLMAGE